MCAGHACGSFHPGVDEARPHQGGPRLVAWISGFDYRDRPSISPVVPRRRRGLVFAGCFTATLDYEPERAILSTCINAQASQLQTNRAIAGDFAPIDPRRWVGRGASAAYSSCGRYRYALSRDLDASGQGVALFVMLNPSTADARRDDPTIRRSQLLARGLGFGTLWVANLFALRSTDPRRLRTHPEPIGPDNDRWIRELTIRSNAVVAAWGNQGAILGRSARTLIFLREAGVPPWAFGITKRGEPRHPLFLPRGSQLFRL